MEYFRLLNLGREPFSNSPDPAFFYHSDEHVGCLQKLELAIRLRRGLNVIIGDIGTGKTTLCRHLIRLFATEEDLQTHLILDPDYGTPLEFLSSLADMFGLPVQLGGKTSAWQIKESIKNHLLKEGVAENKTVVLIIDEGQNTPGFCLEILRELLNYETNESKLLQIVIFAQREFQKTLAEHPNFADRINFYHVLAPLSFRETRKLVQFRLHQAQESYEQPKLFTTLGLFAVYLATGGYPRRIVHLCHRVLLTMIIQNRSKAGWSLVRWCSKMLFPWASFRMPRMQMASVLASLIVVFLVAKFALGQLEIPFFRATAKTETVSVHQQEPLSRAAAEHTEAPASLNTAEPERIISEQEGLNSEPEQHHNVIAVLTDQGTPVPAEPAAFSETELQAESPLAATETFAVPLKASPEAVRGVSGANSRLPGILGKITLRSGDNLETIIRRVYGTFDQQYLQAVMQANRRITNPRMIEAGKSLDFPVLAIKAASVLNHGRWVLVAGRNTLDEAYQLLRAYPQSAPPVCMLPCGNPSGRLNFVVVLRDCCADQQSAELALKELPLSLVSDARILNNGDWCFFVFIRG